MNMITLQRICANIIRKYNCAAMIESGVIMKDRMIRFMQGRYGIDSLSRFLIWTGFGLFIVNIFLENAFIYIISLVCILITYARGFSKNYTRCRLQNEWYLEHTQGIRSLLRRGKIRWRFRKTHHIYCCKKCGQDIKIPKGKGKIMITCPKCRNEFIKKS